MVWQGTAPTANPVWTFTQLRRYHPAPMHARTIAYTAVIAAGLALPATGLAQRAAASAPAGQQQNLLNLGRQQYDELRYEESIQTLSAAIIRRGNTPAQETQIYELLALAYLALNRNDESEGAFRLMLAREPDRRLSTDLAPRIIEFFTGVKSRWEAEGRPGAARAGAPVQQQAAAANVTIEHRSPAQQQREHAVPLTANVVDPQHRVRRLVLAYRQGSRGLFRRVDTTAGETGAFSATIPGSAVRPPLVEYYFEAVDANGVPVQARGDAFAPLRVAVPEPGGIPWWVFVGGGALVVGAGIAIAVVATQSQPATIVIDVQGN